MLGRLLFGGFFVFSGVNHFLMAASMVQYAASKGVPMPEIAIPLTGLMLIAGGMSVLLGFMPQLGALCLVVFLAIVTPVMHNFWAAPAEMRAMEMANFMKNLGLLGGTFFLYGVPTPWPSASSRVCDAGSARECAWSVGSAFRRTYKRIRSQCRSGYSRTPRTASFRDFVACASWSWCAHGTSGKRRRQQLSVADDGHAVHQHVPDADRVLRRPFVGGAVRDRARIEDRDVGVCARTHSALAAHLRHARLQTFRG